MNIEDMEFCDAVIAIPTNAVKLTIEADVYDGSKIVKVRTELPMSDIRDAADRFEQTIAGEYPLYNLTEAGERLLELLERGMTDGD